MTEWQPGDYPGKERIRGQVEAAVRELVDDDGVVEALTERLVEVADGLVVDACMYMLGLHLRTLPEDERKARMFDGLVAMGALEEVAGARSRKRGS